MAVMVQPFENAARFDLAEAIMLLGRTPATLRAWLPDLPAAWHAANEGPGTWSPRDVVAHLADLEDTDWIPRVRIILEFGAGRPFDPVDRVAFRDRLAGRSVNELLDLFAERRTRNLETLRALGAGNAELSLPGMHPALGPVTLRQLLSTWAVHDLTHIVQIARTMARRYDAEVGPWKAYLGVLTRGLPA